MTQEGTTHHAKLTPEEESKYYSQLRLDLAKIIPVDLDRLGEISLYKSSISSTLLSLPIKATNDRFKRNVAEIISDLDVLIRNKNFTIISWFNTTNNMDPNYGFKIKSKYNIFLSMLHYILMILKTNF